MAAPPELGADARLSSVQTSLCCVPEVRLLREEEAYPEFKEKNHDIYSTYYGSLFQ